jgi:hypothetical protein
LAVTPGASMLPHPWGGTETVSLRAQVQKY